jgi:hypothetical protein
MSQTRWSIENGEIKVTIEGPSSQARGKDLLTAAILAMIDAADVEHWEKERLELGVTDDITVVYNNTRRSVLQLRSHGCCAPLPRHGSCSGQCRAV